MSKTLLYGFICGIAYMAFEILRKTTWREHYLLSALFFYALLFILLLIFLRYSWLPSRPGATFGDIFKQGAFFIAAMSLTLAAGLYIYLTYVNPGLMPEIKTWAMQEVENVTGNTVESRAQQKSMDWIYSPFFMSLSAINYLFFGCLFAIILAALLKKK